MQPKETVKIYKKQPDISRKTAGLIGGAAVVPFLLLLRLDNGVIWAVRLYLLYVVLIAVAMLSPLKYFIGVSTLRISETKISRAWLGKITCTLRRENIFVTARKLYFAPFVIFSDHDVSQETTLSIMLKSIRRKVIIFPRTWELVADYPDLFPWEDLLKD